jgi:hypothetical protein
VPIKKEWLEHIRDLCKILPALVTDLAFVSLYTLSLYYADKIINWVGGTFVSKAAFVVFEFLTGSSIVLFVIQDFVRIVLNS